MAETCDDLSEDLVEEELSRDVESLKAILASDTGSEDHTNVGKNYNSIDDDGAAPIEDQYSSTEPLDQLLRCNEKVQQSLRKQLKDIDEALRRNREHQARLSNLTTLSRAKLIANSFTLKIFTRSHSYFFQKAQDQPAALYCEEECVGTSSLFSSRDLAWTSKQEKNLLKGLRRQACDRRIHQLQSTSSLSAKKLKEAIKTIRSLSDEELLMDTSEVNWQVISLEEFNNQCLQADLRLRWKNHLHFDINRSDEWPKDEDKNLLRLAKEQDYRNWVTIAKGLKTNRTAFQCLQRYQQFLNADMINSYTRWTEQEDNALRDAVAKLGCNWAAVSAHLNTNRSSQQCLHRWRYSLAPGKNKGRWDNEEDDALKRGVELCGVGNWSRIASVVQTRNAVQCRERWMNVLDSNIQRGAFTRQEDAKLLEICQQYEGLIPWAEVAAKLGNRTDNMCSRRWKQLSSTTEVMTQYSKRVKQGALRPHTITRTTKHQRTAIVPEEMEDDLMPSSIKKILEEKKHHLIQQEIAKCRPRRRLTVSSSSSVGASSSSELRSPTTPQSSPARQPIQLPLVDLQGGQCAAAVSRPSDTPHTLDTSELCSPALQPSSTFPARQPIQLPLVDLQASASPRGSSSATLGTPRMVVVHSSRRCGVRRRPSVVPTCPVDSVQEMVLAQERSMRRRNVPDQHVSFSEVHNEQVASNSELLPQSPFPSEGGHTPSSSSPSLQDKMPSELYDGGRGCSSSLGVVVRALLEMHGSEPPPELMESGSNGSQYSRQQQHPSNMAVTGGQCLPELQGDEGHCPPGLGVVDEGHCPPGLGEVDDVRCLPELRVDIPSDGPGLGVDNGGKRTRVPAGHTEEGVRRGIPLSLPSAQQTGERRVASVRAPVEVEVQVGEGRLNLEFETRASRLNAILPGLDKATKLVAQECEIPAPPVVRCVNPIYVWGGPAFLQGEQATIPVPAGSVEQGMASPMPGTAAGGSGGDCTQSRPEVVEVVLH